MRLLASSPTAAMVSSQRGETSSSTASADMTRASASNSWRRDASTSARSPAFVMTPADRKSTRLNSSHSQISYAVFCLKKKNKNIVTTEKNRIQINEADATTSVCPHP